MQKPRKDHPQFGLPVALDTRDADDLPLVDGEGDVLQPRHTLGILVCQPIGLHGFAALRLASSTRGGSPGRRFLHAERRHHRSIHFANIAPDHAALQLVHLCRRTAGGRSNLACAQHADAVRDRLDLGQLVRDQHNRAAAFGNAAYRTDKSGNFFGK